MAKSPNQKLKLLYLYQILLQRTDEEHPITVPQLIGELDLRGIRAERKSVYDDLEALRLFGLDVQSRKGRSPGWFVGRREFELPELKLLVDSVQSSKFITHKKTASLIKKIETLASVHSAQLLHRQVFVKNRIKTMNESIYYNVDELHRAIAADLAERDVDYGDFVTIQRDASGAITAMTTDMAALNQLRAQLVAQILSALEGVDASEIRIPLGSLVDSELVWARGPELRVRALRVGTVSAEFRSDFSQAGVNQTLHRIELEVAVPVTLILPGGQTELTVETGLRVAETVIVGAVPDTYLTLNGAA